MVNKINKSSIKSKDLHRHKEKGEHSNIQWIKDWSPFPQQGQNLGTIVRHSTISNCNSGIYICNQLIRLRAGYIYKYDPVKTLNLNECIQGWAWIDF